MFSNWLSGLPGDAERFLEESVTMAQPIQWATLTARVIGWRTGKMTGTGTIREIARVNGTMMKVPIESKFESAEQR